MQSIARSGSHVVTSPRRDVSSKICISSFNVRTARNLGDGEAYEERHGFQEPEDPDFERVPGICTTFHFVRYYLGYYDDVFDTRHFVLFFHDVLDLFLGLHQNPVTNNGLEFNLSCYSVVINLSHLLYTCISII